MKIYIIITIITGIMLSLAVGCSSKNYDKSADPETVDSASLPDSEVRGATIDLFDRGYVTAKIRADFIRKYDEIDSTMGYVLDIVTFDSLGLANSTITGDSGIIWEGRGDLEIFGNVVAVDSDSTRLETNYLIWNKVTRKLKTDAFVRITHPDGSVVTGWGMEAERNPNRYRILRQVSGTVKDVESAGNQ